MAKIKSTMTVSLEEFGKKAGEYALDEFEYKGLTIRQWADKITSGEYQPVKHGKWEMNSDYPDRLICNQCNSTYDVYFSERDSMHYCSNCGCYMRENGDKDA